MPLAVARLLAIEEDSSRALDLPVRGSLGGPWVESGDVDLASSFSLDASAAVAMAVASMVAARGSTSSTTGRSCLVLMICPSLRCCCSNRFNIRMASESFEV